MLATLAIPVKISKFFIFWSVTVRKNGRTVYREGVEWKNYKCRASLLLTWLKSWALGTFWLSCVSCICSAFRLHCFFSWQCLRYDVSSSWWWWWYVGHDSGGGRWPAGASWRVGPPSAVQYSLTIHLEQYSIPKQFNQYWLSSQLNQYSLHSLLSRTKVQHTSHSETKPLPLLRWTKYWGLFIKVSV